MTDLERLQSTEITPTPEMATLDCGTCNFGGDEIFINAAEYDTKPRENSIFEAHRKYVDIMLMLDGEERIGCKQVDKLFNITQPYDENGDALIAAMEQEFTSVYLAPGDMVVFFPEDGHAPGMDWNGSSHVKKLIAKVLL